MMPRVLFVEDDHVIRSATAETLVREGFDVVTAQTGKEGLDAFLAQWPNIALLDIMLPEMDGVELCRAIVRESESSVPVVLLSARSDARDIVDGLQAGADDYVTKPFDSAVLVARLHAVLRRRGPNGGRVLRAGPLTIDRGQTAVWIGDASLTLTATEYKLLVHLAETPTKVFTRDELLREVWGYGWSGDTRLVDVHVQRLREKVGTEAIRTVRGVGYGLSA